MEGLAPLTQQLATRDAGPGAVQADPLQVAEFARLMQQGQVAQAMPDVYIAQQITPTDALSAAVMRAGMQISASFREQSAQGLAVAPANASDTAGMEDRMTQLFQMQKGLMDSSFQLQFASSLVESANRGISSLFHMQG